MKWHPALWRLHSSFEMALAGHVLLVDSVASDAAALLAKAFDALGLLYPIQVKHGK